MDGDNVVMFVFGVIANEWKFHVLVAATDDDDDDPDSNLEDDTANLLFWIVARDVIERP